MKAIELQSDWNRRFADRLFPVWIRQVEANEVDVLTKSARQMKLGFFAPAMVELGPARLSRLDALSIYELAHHRRLGSAQAAEFSAYTRDRMPILRAWLPKNASNLGLGIKIELIELARVENERLRVTREASDLETRRDQVRRVWLARRGSAALVALAAMEDVAALDSLKGLPTAKQARFR